MPPRKIKRDPKKQARIVAEARRSQAERQQGYREKALSLFPHVCGKCGRDFSGPSLRELTVHHKDHNHDHNPPDGSNWELLCLHCHDDEHQKEMKTGTISGVAPSSASDSSLGFKAFEGLKDLLKPEGDEGPDNRA